MAVEPSFSDYLTFVGMVGTVFMVLVTGFWRLSNFINKQFLSTKQMIVDQGEVLKNLFMKRIEDHEQLDQLRFKEVRESITDLRIREAARYGLDDHQETIRRKRFKETTS